VIAAPLLAVFRAMGLLMPFPATLLLPAGFVLMMLTPFLALDRPARRQMGLTRPRGAASCWRSVAWGSGMAAFCFFFGWFLYGASPDHWFVSIRNYYQANPSATGRTPWVLFLIFTGPALIFSPLGEEIFFRGYLQDALEERFSIRAGTWLESLAFGAVHLLHHGIVLAEGEVWLRPVSGPLWFALMTGAGLIFARLRRQSDSLWPPILAHAAFNLVMNATIFAILW